MFADKSQSTKTVLRLVYDHGVFRPLDPLTLSYQDGDEVVVELLTPREQARLILGDMLEAIPDDPAVDEIDEAATMARLHASFAPGTTLSDIIEEDREAGW